MYISTLLLILLIGAITTFLTNTRESARLVSTITSFIALGISIIMFLNYDPSLGFNFEENYAWIPSIGISYHVGVDGIGLPMVLLTTLVSAFCSIYAWEEKKRANQFFGLLLLMDFSLCGVFVSLDFFLFYIFWELVLIPMFFLIGVWGGPRKDYSAMKFLIYTHVASVMMLLGIFGIFYFHGQTTGVYTFDMPVLLKWFSSPVGISSFWINFIFAALLFGFLVKMPAVPFHTWLPDAHVEAPTIGSILLAGVLLKMGGYGLFRVLIPIVPNVSIYFMYVIAVLGVLSIWYSAIAALAQRDLKRLVAFSSIGHMGFISLGVAASIAAGMEIPRIFAQSGAMFQMFSHGIITSVLFGSCGVIEHHTGTRIIEDLGGLTKKMPKFAFLMIAGFFASLGLPGMSGFIAEFSVIVGSYPELPSFVIVAVLSIPVVAAYHLWAIQRAMFGPYNEYFGDISDVTWYEFTALAAWVVLIVFLGVYPMPIYGIMHETAIQYINLLPGGIA
ncbi:MAG: complex I subunit 4 family protein [Candidatus Syntropharchaeia archaeon]